MRLGWRRLRSCSGQCRHLVRAAETSHIIFLHHASRIVKNVKFGSQIYPLDCRVPEHSLGRDKGTNKWRATAKEAERPIIARRGSVFPVTKKQSAEPGAERYTSFQNFVDVLPSTTPSSSRSRANFSRAKTLLYSP